MGKEAGCGLQGKAGGVTARGHGAMENMWLPSSSSITAPSSQAVGTAGTRQRVAGVQLPPHHSTQRFARAQEGQIDSIGALQCLH